MPTRKRSHAALRELCARPQEEDGIDPREWSKPTKDESRAEKARRRKDLQLCKQARMAIDAALACATDERLRALRVCCVEPAPDARRLRVQLGAPAWVLDTHQKHTHEQLQLARGYLRGEIAAAISRKKTPQLMLVLIPLPLEDIDET